jgi:hypothetical protein
VSRRTRRRPSGAESRRKLDALLAHIRENGRVCPIPDRWNQLCDMLPSRRRVGQGSEPPPPLILAAWDTPALIKMMRLEEHIRYAVAHGVLADIDQYLRRLPGQQWAHLGDFTVRRLSREELSKWLIPRA